MSSASQQFSMNLNQNPHQPSLKTPSAGDSSLEPQVLAKVHLHGFHRCSSPKINFWSLGGEPLDRLQLRFYLAQFGTIVRMFLRHGSLEGFVEYTSDTNLNAVAGRSVVVAGGSSVALVQGSLPRVFLGGLNPRTTEEAVRAAVAPYGRVAKFNRPRRNGREAGYCLLTFFREEEVVKILQQRRLEVMGRQVSVRMEGEKKEKDRIYDAYGPDWREGRTLLLYGFAEPNALTEQDVRETMTKYGSVRAVSFVFKDGRRQPRCFVDFTHEASVTAALRLGAACVRDQLVGFMEVTSSFLAAVTHRPKVKVTEDPLDDDSEVPPVKEFDITKEEKEEALRRAVSLLDVVKAAFFHPEETSLVKDIKLLASGCPKSNIRSKRERKNSHGEINEEKEDIIYAEEEEEEESWEYDEQEVYEDEGERGAQNNNESRKDLQQSQYYYEKLCNDNSTQKRTPIPEGGMKSMEMMNSKMCEGHSMPLGILCTRPCVKNYGAVREKVLELTRRCLERGQTKNSSSWSRLLQASLRERKDAVMQPAPARDTLEVKDWTGDEYVPDEGCRVYIQNLPEGVERQALLRHFTKFGDVLRLYLTRGNKGFVEYEFREPVAAVLSKKRHIVCGKEIRVLKSFRNKPQVWVGSLPRGTEPEEVARAASVFGVVQDVTIPPGRSYGFVAFMEEEAARSAVDCGETLLRGRRLLVRPVSKGTMTAPLTAAPPAQGGWHFVPPSTCHFKTRL